MRRASWSMAALAVLALGGVPGAAGEARGQWAEVSTVRYGLFGRPRAIETRLVPTVSVAPTTYVIEEPVVATRYVRAIAADPVVATSYVPMASEAVPTTYVSPSYPVVSTGYVATGYVPAGTVVRSYAPAVRVVSPRVYIVP